MSDTKVPKILIKRWADSYTLLGQPVLVKDLDEAANLLCQNEWMRGWITSKIKEALLSGACFQHEKRIEPGWRGREDGVVSEWRIATDSEVLDFADTAKYCQIAGHAISKRAQEKGYVLHYHEGAELIKAYDLLPRQAKTILDMLNESNRESFTEASIGVILTENAERLNTRQDVMKIFAFYRKRLVDEGHLEEAGEE